MVFRDKPCGKHADAGGGCPLPEMGTGNDGVKGRNFKARVGGVDGKHLEVVFAQGGYQALHFNPDIVVGQIRQILNIYHPGRMRDKTGIFNLG